MRQGSSYVKAGLALRMLKTTPTRIRSRQRINMAGSLRTLDRPASLSESLALSCLPLESGYPALPQSSALAVSFTRNARGAKVPISKQRRLRQSSGMSLEPPASGVDLRRLSGSGADPGRSLAWIHRFA